MPSSRTYDLTFFTATILEWKHILTYDLCKDIIIDSPHFFVTQQRVQLNTFVIMNNHLHLIWHIFQPFTREQVQRSFLRYTAQMIIRDLRNNNPDMLHDYFVGAADRKYQIWERNPLSVAMWPEEVLRQKLDYIHSNPVKAGYCLYPEQYKYSTAAIYLGLPSEWDFVTPCY